MGTVELSRETGRETCQVVGVAILRPGVFNGEEFTPEWCEALCASYDTSIYRAKLNLDHDDSGPAQYGSVDRLYWDGEWVRCDLVNVPVWLAEEIQDDGAWPSRSVEAWLEREGLGKPYLSGLAFLGCKEPAVLGMPPITEGQIYYPPDLVYSFAVNGEKVRLTLSPSTGEDITGKEDSMPETTDTARVELDAVREREAQAKLEADKAKAELAAEREQRAGLEAVVAKMLEKQQRTEAETFIAKLEADGKLTPGMRDEGLLELLVQLGKSDGKISLEAQEPKPTVDVLKAVLEALPVVKDMGGEFAGLDREVPAKTKASLSASVRTLADKFGVSEETIQKYMGGEEWQ